MRYFAITGPKGEYYSAPDWLPYDTGALEGVYWAMPESGLPAEWMPNRPLGSNSGYVLIPEHMLLKWIPELTAPAWKHSFLLCAASGRGRSKRRDIGHAFEEARLLEIVGITDRVVWSRVYVRIFKRALSFSSDQRIAKAISVFEDFSDGKIDERIVARSWSEAQNAMKEGMKHALWIACGKGLAILLLYMTAGAVAGYFTLDRPIVGAIVGLVVFGFRVAFSGDPTVGIKQTYAQYWLFEAERRLSDLKAFHGTPSGGRISQ